MRRNCRISVGKRIVCLLLALAFSPAALGCAALGGEEGTAGNGLVINEVVSSNKRSLVDEHVGSPDWLELYNGSSAPISLKNCGLSDNLRNLHKYVFEDITIQPGEYLVVYAGDNSGVTKTEAPCTGFGLSKSGDYLFLTDEYYGVLQQLEIPPLYTDVSYARREDGTFGFCATPTPGAANTEPIENSLDDLFATRSAVSLTISEVLPKDPEGGFSWVELHNAGDSAILLDGYYLSDSETNVTRWQMPATTVEPGGYACIYLSGQGTAGESGIHAPFKLGSEDTCLILTDLYGNTADRMDWVLGLPAGISVVKIPEGAAYSADPTFEAANSEETFTGTTMSKMDSSDPVHISEVVVKNTLSATDGDGDRSEWVELANYSPSAVSLSGYYLSDSSDNLFKWELPDTTLEPGGYLLVFLSGKNRTEGELHASFGLSEEETGLHLTSIKGLRTESVPLDGLTKDNMSVGYDSGGNLRYYAYPTPGYENANGFETADMIGFFNSEGVFISEVCAVNAVKSGENDWIELYNGGASPVDLTGWYLSDSVNEPQKWQFPPAVIQPGEYLVVETTSHVTRQSASVANFGIRTGGETLVLSDASGKIVDAFATGAQAIGRTSGRVESDPSIQRVFFASPTKGGANSASVFAGKAPEPTFSQTGLYHSEEFQLVIACRDPNAVIYYTTDGDEPDASCKVYTGPITVAGNTPIRAAAYVDGKVPSDIMTATYLFSAPHTVPVVCVTGNPDRVHEVMRVNDREDKVEREATIAYYEADGTLGTAFPAGIKPKGAGTVAYAQKSLSINLRAGYGQSSVTYPFFPDYAFDTFSALVVRNGGQDWSHARIRDAYCAALVTGMHVDNSATRPVVVYINGQYNGLYDLGEDQNSAYLVTHYGVDGDTVDVIRRNETATTGSNEDIKRVRKFALNNDLSDDAVYEEFCQWVDVEFFTDYFIAQTYLCNSDMFNQKYWRSQDYAVKWRPIFYDLDFGFANSASRTMIGQYFNENGVPSADGSLTYFEIYIGLKKNAGWRAYAVDRYVECIYKYFNAERATSILDEMADALRPEMDRQIAKWHKPSSVKAWEEEIASLRETAENRPAYALEEVRKYFGVSQSEFDAIVDKYAGA